MVQMYRKNSYICIMFISNFSRFNGWKNTGKIFCYVL